MSESIIGSDSYIGVERVGGIMAYSDELGGVGGNDATLVSYVLSKFTYGMDQGRRKSQWQQHVSFLE